jgi:hypothetical protein
VRVAAVRADGDDGRLARHDAAGAKLREHPLLQIVFGERLPGADFGSGVQEGFLGDAINDAAGFDVRFVLLHGPAGLELLHKIGGAHHAAAVRANEFHSAGVDERYIRDGVARRILHGNFFDALEQARQICFEFTEAGIDAPGAGEAFERARLDAVHELARRAARGNEIEPTARAERIVVEPEHAMRDGIAMVKIVEEPGVEPGGAQLLLDSGNGRHQVSDRVSGPAGLRPTEGAAIARTCAAVAPRTSTRLVRLRWPETILTAACGTFKQTARKWRSASLARPSTGGAARRMRSAPSRSPAASSREARGCR